jgi:hypothetical protein|tara:strand:- start:695 stop:1288 length:594 start_codon:yes stop_codon:yes gene_type:complete
MAPFWSDNFAESTQLKDPKRQFRFKVEFTGISAPQGGALMWYAKTVNKPSFTINTAEHQYLNHTFYYPGAVTWNPITVTLVDPRDPDMTATLSDIVNLSGYTPPSNPNSLGSMSKSRAAGALGAVYISQIDGDGNEIEKWTLWNAFISDVKYGDLAYGTDDLVELSLELRYDWARLQTMGGPSRATGGNESQTFFQS